MIYATIHRYQMEADHGRPRRRTEGGGHCQKGSEVARYRSANPSTIGIASIIKTSIFTRSKPIPSTRQGATTEPSAAGRDGAVAQRAVGRVPYPTAVGRLFPVKTFLQKDFLTTFLPFLIVGQIAAFWRKKCLTPWKIRHTKIEKSASVNVQNCAWLTT